MKGPGKGWAVMGRTAVRGGGGGCCNTEPIEWGRGGGIVVCAAAALAPLPHTSKELEQCWQICLHVFIIIKNVTDPSSLEVQQIPLITFLSLLPLQSFCILSFILSTPSPPPRSV